jgi:hypothetical protein
MSDDKDGKNGCELCSRRFYTAVEIVPILYEVCRFVRAYRCKLLAEGTCQTGRRPKVAILPRLCA